MSPDTSLKIASLAMMAAGLLTPSLVLFALVRWVFRGNIYAALGGAALGLAAGFYLVFFQLFPDTLRAGPTGPQANVEIVVPDGYRGFVYLFFDSRQAALRPSNPNVYTLFVPSTGRLRAGQYPGQTLSTDNVRFFFRYLNGEAIKVAEGSLTAGGQTKDGHSVVYIRPFLGPTAEFEAIQRERLAKNTFFDELDVFDEMLRQAREPEAPVPGSLEGIEKAPAP